MKKKDLTVWMMWSLLALAFGVTMFHRSALAVVIDYLMLDLNVEDAAVMGTLAGTYAVIYMIMQLPSGLLADLWGPRKTVAAGMLVACIGTFMFGAADTIVLAFVGRGLVGLGVSVVFVSAIKFLSVWFKPVQFATMLGMTVLYGNLGGLAGTVPMSVLVTQVGWRNSFYVVGTVTFLVSVLCFLFLRDKPDTVEVTKKDTGDKYEIVKALKAIFKNQYTWKLLIINFGIAGTMLAFSGAWSVPYLMQVYDLNRNQAAGYMLAMFIGKIIGFPFAGFISDRIVKRKLPILAFFSLYLLLWSTLLFFTQATPVSALLYTFFLLGFSSGAMVLIPTLAKELNDSNYSGIAVSVINAGPFIGMAVFQPIMGYILDLKWEGTIFMGVRHYPFEAYRLIFLMCVGVIIISFIMVTQLRETNCQNTSNITEKV